MTSSTAAVNHSIASSPPSSVPDSGRALGRVWHKVASFMIHALVIKILLRTFPQLMPPLLYGMATLTVIVATIHVFRKFARGQTNRDEILPPITVIALGVFGISRRLLS